LEVATVELALELRGQGRQFLEFVLAQKAVAVRVEFVEDPVGERALAELALTQFGEELLELLLADLAVAVGIRLLEQFFQAGAGDLPLDLPLLRVVVVGGTSRGGAHQGHYRQQTQGQKDLSHRCLSVSRGLATRIDPQTAPCRTPAHPRRTEAIALLLELL